MTFSQLCVYSPYKARVLKCKISSINILKFKNALLNKKWTILLYLTDIMNEIV